MNTNDAIVAVQEARTHEKAIYLAIAHEYPFSYAKYKTEHKFYGLRK